MTPWGIQSESGDHKNWDALNPKCLVTDIRAAQGPSQQGNPKPKNTNSLSLSFSHFSSQYPCLPFPFPIPCPCPSGELESQTCHLSSYWTTSTLTQYFCPCSIPIPIHPSSHWLRTPIPILILYLISSLTQSKSLLTRDFLHLVTWAGIYRYELLCP